MYLFTKKLQVMWILLLFLLAISIQFSFAHSIYKNKRAPIENRIKDLVNRMTLEEKILQLNQYIAGINAGEKAVFKFEINPMRDLSFTDSDGKRIFEEGEYYRLMSIIRN